MVLRLMSWLMYMVFKISKPLFWLLNCLKSRKIISPINDPILLQSASELARKIRQGEISSETAVKSFIQRIEQVNPSINAVVDNCFDAALAAAQECDKILREKKITIDEIAREKPLFGVPISVKESCSLAGMSYTGCTTVRREIISDKDSPVVELMKKSGAIPLCVTNTPEMCFGFESTNLLYGTTKNPYDGRRSAGGSSSGEGALIAAGGSLLGVGSDIAGSIRVPAHFNGIFGHKPTHGIIPSEGHFPMPPDPNLQKFFTYGPLARYAEDLKLAMKIMSSEYKKDLQLDEPIDISKLNVFALHQSDVGFGVIPTDESIKNAIDKAAKYLGSKGAKVIYPTIEGFDEVLEITSSLFFCGTDHGKILINPNDPTKNVNGNWEFLKSLIGMSAYSMQVISTNTLKNLNGFMSQSDKPKYIEKGKNLRENLIKLLGDDGVLFLPTSVHSAPLFGQTLFVITGFHYTLIWNCLGFPATHVPMGLDTNKMPIGVQVIAAPNQDRLCLAVAIALEKEFGGWILPPSTDK